MARLLINIDSIKQNINTLNQYFKERNIQWSLITKVFSGDKTFLQKILTDELIQSIHSVGDSRLTSIKNIKEIRPDIRTIYIKPPAIIHTDEVVKYADISLNSSYKTILALDKAAQKQNKIHYVIIMIELGELREGIQHDEIINFYQKTLDLKHINVVGIGSNLGCMYGVEPTYDKLLQLVLYKNLISSKFNEDLPLISGGTSITLPLVEKGIVPPEINHFRVGESVFFGISPLDNAPFKNLNTHTFEFQSNIIEIEEKNRIPNGTIGDGNVGHTADFSMEDINQTTHKAILDFGHLDVDRENVETDDPNLKFVGITSDMTVVDIGTNLNDQDKPRYQVGQQISFKPSYLGVARLLNSKFIDKIFVDSPNTLSKN